MPITVDNGDLTDFDVDVGAGAVDANTQRVTLASDDPAVASLDAIEAAVEGTLTVGLPSGAATEAKQDSQITLLAGGLPAALAAGGGLKVEGVAGGVAVPVSGTFFQATQPVSGTVDLGATDNAVLDAIAASLALLDNSISAGNELQVDVVAALPAGDNNIGNVDLASAIPAGTNNIGDVDVLTLPGVAGTAAHDAALSGNPVRIGARGVSADPTAITSGRTVDLLASLLGKQIVLPYCHPGAQETYASPAAVTDTADDEAFAAVASTRHYITGVQVFNGHDTVGTEVVIKDGSTVLWRGWAEQTGGGCSAKFDPPLRGTANTAVNVANITTGSSTYFNLQGFKATE